MSLLPMGAIPEKKCKGSSQAGSLFGKREVGFQLGVKRVLMYFQIGRRGMYDLLKFNRGS